MNIKKIVCAAIVVVACVSAASAKVQPNGLGIRGGILFGGSAEINYQRASWALFGSDRFELGVGWDSWYGDDHWHNNARFERSEGSIGFSAVTQWHWNISPTVARGGFNWYVGPGAGVGFTFRDATWEGGETGVRPPDHWVDDNLSVWIGGQIGIEYDFNALGAPLNISLDTRPMINVINTNLNHIVDLNGIIGGIRMGIRFTF